MANQFINFAARKQNWAKLTPWLGIITFVLIFKYFNYKDVQFWALINIPLYLFHQMDEHYLPGGFKNFINQIVCKLPSGAELLTDIKIFWINILFVWVLFLILALLILNISIGFGIIMIIISAVNCLSHIVLLLKLKMRNPGVIVALFQFIICVYAAYYISINAQLSNLGLWWIVSVISSVVFHVLAYQIMRAQKTK
ncbi:MAG: HXXEE domain-containing protein [Neisseriaceae bacterium]